MNELIQELAYQAEELADAEVDQGSEFHPAFCRIFAQLIVKQCGYYADVFEGLGCPQDMDPTETKPSDYIKRQFGVAE